MQNAMVRSIVALALILAVFFGQSAHGNGRVAERDAKIVELKDEVSSLSDKVALYEGNQSIRELLAEKEALNNKIAQEQQIQTERHRVEVARLQAEQQRLLNQTLTPEALMKQYLEVLHEMRTSNNTIILVPTEGGTPILNLGDLRRNLRPQ